MTTAIRSSHQVAALLAAATKRGAVTVNERLASAAPSGGRYLLPSDLASALRHLCGDELNRLSDAVTAEITRRTPARETSRRGSHPSPASRTEARSKEEQPVINVGRANAIRAAVKAGVKPATIARQFGVSLAAIRQVLADRS